MAESPTRLLRDLVYQQMQLAKSLRNAELYKQLKAQYSQLCADYYDEIYEQLQREDATQ